MSYNIFWLRFFGVNKKKKQNKKSPAVQILSCGGVKLPGRGEMKMSAAAAAAASEGEKTKLELHKCLPDVPDRVFLGG